MAAASLLAQILHLGQEGKIIMVSKRTRRYFIAIVLTFITVTASDRSHVMESSESTESFDSEEIRCAIVLGDDMYSDNGLNTGFNYELLGQFARTSRRDIEIVTSRRGENYLDSLREGKVDIAVILPSEAEGLDELMISMKTGDNSVWAVRKDNPNDILSINSWISYFEKTPEYNDAKERFFNSFDPDIKSRTSHISPYDSLIKQFADTLGWDWRMLAAVVYQESRFSINSFSGRGAAGLMQVMPSTAEHYGIMDLTDPYENMKAGTMHLARLQEMFNGLDTREKVMFTLAAYNAGEGRIADCRNLAKVRGLDPDKWEEVIQVIPEMRLDSILKEECVRLGKFQGHETISYVKSIIDIYNTFCTVCPA